MGSRLDHINDWESRARRAKYRVAKLARNLKVTSRQLERYFLKTLRGHPKEWMKELRMKEALRLMRRGLLDKQIAARLGFKHASHFSRAFRKRLKPAISKRLDK
jgi:transcriptional regulator GlxA family with amidase domain